MRLIFFAIVSALHLGPCFCQRYYERNPLPVETVPFDGSNYDEDYTEGYDFFENKDIYRWNVGEYPHPLTNYRYCNRMRESYVCDPDQILNKEEADKLDSLIRQLYKETPCICDQCQKGDGGIVVGIALLKHMFQPYNQHPSKTIRSFAENLRSNWKLSKCDNDILIVVATTDRLSYTDVGQSTSTHVSLDEAHRIFLENKAHFSGGRFFEGLRAMLADYHSRTRGMRAPVRGGAGSQDMGVVTGSIVGAVLLLGIVLFVGFVVYRYCKNKEKDVEMDGDHIDSKSEGITSSWNKRDIRVLFNSLKSTNKTQQSSSPKYQPCDTTDDNKADDTFRIGDEVIDTTLATRQDDPNDTTVTVVTADADTSMLDKELTEAVDGITQTFKPKRDFKGHETDL